MAYISYDHASSATARPTATSHLAWGRLAVIGACIAFWIGAAFAIAAIV